MKVLLHVCCANCAIYPVTKFREQGIKTELYWYNPNIHPYKEYKMRMDTMRELQKAWGLTVFYSKSYDIKTFFQEILFKERYRCTFCYKMRLSKTAEHARSRGFYYFSTTLLSSPYQNRNEIIKNGRCVAEIRGLQFYVDDFSEGWNESREMSKELSLYRQKYCGCIFSDAEKTLNGYDKNRSQKFEHILTDPNDITTRKMYKHTIPGLKRRRKYRRKKYNET